MPTGGAPKTGQRPWYDTNTKQTPWAATPAPVSDQASNYRASQWKLEDVAKSEATFTQEFKSLLWERYKNLPDGERNSLFWQGVRQNPELAAASFVRRALENMKRANEWMNSDAPPKLDRALRDTMENNEIRKWLRWVRRGGTMPIEG